MKLITRLSCMAIAMLPALTFVNGQTAATTEQTNQPTESQVSLGENVKMKIGGFARADFFYDTRKNVEILDGLLDMYPTNKSLDANGKDLNDVSLLRMSAAASRLNAKFTGPDFLNAKTSSLVEFDFTGYNGIGLRLRHAWVKLNWEKSELLFGRFWHPMFILDAFPTVLALNTGAPFCVFNRAEQLRFTYNLGQISLMAAAAGQMDYGFSLDADKATYLHNQILPDITLNAQLKTDNIILGVSGNYKMNQPRLFTTQDYTVTTNPKYKTDEKIASMSAQAYAQYKIGLLKIKGSALYGENMMELLMMGGYAVKSVDPTTFKETYSTVKNMNYWCNIVYGDKLQAILFVGYMKNLGTTDKQIVGFTKTSARGYEANSTGNGIANMIRIAPSVSYKVGRVQMHLELEHNIVAYGKYVNATNVINENAEVKDTKNISNTRVQFATIFYF